jgi:UDP-3-O-[3-hydroxymyristoyl] N-acetylglucosamine deacetylase
MVTINGSALDGSAARAWLSRTTGPVTLGRRGAATAISAAALTSTFRTTTVNGIAMVEHLFAAAAGLGIHRDLSIEVDGDALPILDGSGAGWAKALQSLRVPPSTSRLRVVHEARIAVDGAQMVLEPSDSIEVGVELEDLPAGAVPHATWHGVEEDFLSRIAPARTFFFESDVDTMLAGGVRAEIDPSSVVVVTKTGLMSAGTAPEPDEPARHKLLDLLGDLFVWGGPPIGSLRVTRPGHSTNHALIRSAVERGALALTVFLLFFLSVDAHAQQQDRLERPPTLPDLAHPFADLVVEHTFAGLALDGNPPRKTEVSLHRLSFDVPLVPRRWYLSGAWGVALGTSSDGSVAGAPTNTEIGIRAIWTTITGLGFGGGIAIVAPTSSVATGSSGALALGEAAAIRAWDRPLFEPETFAIRPFVDLRTVTGHFTIQFRQSLDMIASGRSAIPLQESYRIAAIAFVYVGYRIVDWLAAGAEIAERYDMDSATADTDRPRFAVTGSLRAITRWLQPGISVTTGLGSPLNAFSTIGSPFDRSPTSFVSVRLGFVFTGFNPPW